MDDALGTSLATVVRDARSDLGLSVAALAQRSGVSRAMISKVERGEVQPTAALLAKLSGALGLTLSQLVARAEGNQAHLLRKHEQPVWVDPETGYRRRAVSPPSSPVVELVEVELPGGAEIGHTADAFRFIEQQVWVLDGHLRFVEGEQVHELDAGDSLHLGPPTDCRFVNPGAAPVRYLVAIEKLAPRRGR